MIGTTVTYRDEHDRNLRGIVVGLRPVAGSPEPELDLVVVDPNTAAGLQATAVPHYSHKLQPIELRTVDKRGTELVQTVQQRQPGAHWRR